MINVTVRKIKVLKKNEGKIEVNLSKQLNTFTEVEFAIRKASINSTTKKAKPIEHLVFVKHTKILKFTIRKSQYRLVQPKKEKANVNLS